MRKMLWANAQVEEDGRIVIDPQAERKGLARNGLLEDLAGYKVAVAVLPRPIDAISLEEAEEHIRSGADRLLSLAAELEGTLRVVLAGKGILDWSGETHEQLAELARQIEQVAHDVGAEAFLSAIFAGKAINLKEGM